SNEETDPILIENYIDLGALYNELKDLIQESTAPLKPVKVFELLKMIYEGGHHNNGGDICFRK
ncbi:8419_t:CDS:2, partial [Entrophospora sp. SA101]